jgi:hypothetical protein
MPMNAWDTTQNHHHLEHSYSHRRTSSDSSFDSRRKKDKNVAGAARFYTNTGTKIYDQSQAPSYLLDSIRPKKRGSPVPPAPPHAVILAYHSARYPLDPLVNLGRAKVPIIQPNLQ